MEKGLDLTTKFNFWGKQLYIINVLFINKLTFFIITKKICFEGYNTSILIYDSYKPVFNSNIQNNLNREKKLCIWSFAQNLIVTETKP